MKYYPQWKPGIKCPYNEAVICPDCAQCSKCGWYPPVAEKRLAEVTSKNTKRRKSANG